MFQYYTIKNDISEGIWDSLVAMFSLHQSIEMIEYFGAYADATSRKIARERIINPKRYFNNLEPEDYTVSMRPLMLKWDSFSFIYSYTLSSEVLSYLENNWEGDMELESFSIKDDQSRPIFNYHPLERPVILLGTGELKWAKSIGLELDKCTILLNNIID